MVKGGARLNSGQKGYGQSLLFEKEFNKFEPLFWAELTKFIKSDVKEDRKFAMQEFNKINTKKIPQENTGEVNFNVTIKDYVRGENKSTTETETIPPSG